MTCKHECHAQTTARIQPCKRHLIELGGVRGSVGVGTLGGWRCRVKAGEWLGPWVLCHALEAVMKKMEPASLNVHVHVVSQPGGAVPVLYTARQALSFPLRLQYTYNWV